MDTPAYTVTATEFPPQPRRLRRGLLRAVGVPHTLKIFTMGVTLLHPRANKGRPRQHAVPSEVARGAPDVLAGCHWRRVAWRQSTKGMLSARFAAVRVRVADGTRSPRHGHLPGEEVWLIGEWRTSNSGRNSDSMTSKDVPGPACTDTRS